MIYGAGERVRKRGRSGGEGLLSRNGAERGLRIVGYFLIK